MPAFNSMEEAENINVVYIEIIYKKNVIVVGLKCSNSSLSLHYFCKVL